MPTQPEYVWIVLIEEYNDDGHVTGVETIAYATEQTAKQHADRDAVRYAKHPVQTKLRSY